MLGILLSNKSLGSTWNKIHCGIQAGGFCNFVLEGQYLISFDELKCEPKYVELSGSEQKKMKMIRVNSSFADRPVNFNPTGPAEDQTQKLISSTDLA